jgi:hypothetical protein
VLTDLDRIEPLDVRVAVEHEDAVDQAVRVLHLVDGEAVEDLAEPWQPPVVEHPGVEEVGVRDRQLERERLVQELHDAGVNWLH